MKCEQIVKELDRLSPEVYACEWDNVGLLVGRKDKQVHRIVVALDASKDVVHFAVEQKADMLVTHHPMIFSALKQVNENHFTSEKVLTLAENGIAYYAMHTNFDAVGGMAELAAGTQYLNLSDVQPIALCTDETQGMGRYGRLPYPMTAGEVASYVKEKFGLSFVMLYQREKEKERIFDTIAVMPGSGKSEMKAVKQNGYDLYLTGDFGHHEGLDALDMGMTIIDATHYGLEHIFVSYIVNYLRQQFSEEIEVIQADFGCPVQVV